MSRRSVTERSAQLKGRPKRRAATTHLFKYQLAKNPNRAEEDALKRALQESLEEHNDTLSQTLSTKNKGMIRCKNNRALNSSTNSSDLSKTSNNSSSASNTSRGSMNGSVKKRIRTDIANPDSRALSNNRARPTTNGHKANNMINHNKDDCDKDPSVLYGSPLPLLNKAIRTYSRSQVNGHHDLRQQEHSSDVTPRSSTPITREQALSDEKSTVRRLKSLDKDCQVSVSRSTQTSVPIVKSSNTQVNGHNTSSYASSTKAGETVDRTVDSCDTSQTSRPVEEQHLKLKRESKNYAYAKMTALKVNTYKSPYNYLKSNHVKKVSPVSVLNNNSNKNTVKTYSKVKKSSLGQMRTGTSEGASKTGKNSPSLGSTRESNRTISPQAGKSATDCIPKHITSAEPGLKNNYPTSTVDLSDINFQSQSSVSATKKSASAGSWSLLGVPEEKVVYLRDDEPPRRLICYPAIKHVEGDVIQVRDSVLLRSGAKTTDLPYIAKVSAFWADPETGGVMMSLFWYYRPEHIEEGRKPHHLPDEIFASRHRDVDSVECIEDKCYVLTFNEYCRYKKRVKMEQVSTTWSLADVTIPVSNESYPRRNRIPDTDVNPELVFCCRQIYDSRMKRLIKNPLINSKYGHI